MDLIQSRVVSIFKADLGLYELRLLMKIIESVQPLFRHDKMTNIIKRSMCTDNINVNFAIACKDILRDNSHHYELAYNAAKRLLKIFVSYYDENKKIHYDTGLISNLRTDENSGTIKFTAAKWLMEAIVNFTFGYNMYNLQKAFELKNPCAIRMYMLTCSATQPIVYSVDFLKGILGVDGKYKQTRDFIKRCIEPAKKELADRNINGFDYETVLTKNKVTSIRIKPVKRQEQTVNQLAAQASLSAFCPNALRQYLDTQCDIKPKELASHKIELNEFCKIPAWQDIIIRIVEGQRRKRAGKGYIFAAIKKEVIKYNSADARK